MAMKPTLHKKHKMEKSAKIYVAGHNGLVGSAIIRGLKKSGYNNIITKTSQELDLTNQNEVNNFFATKKPEYVFLCAAKVGGIMANKTYPAEFIYINMMIACNVINAAYNHSVKKLLNLGSSCIYPRLAPQPMKEDYLLTSELEPTNEAYAIAKIAAIKLCRYYNQQYNTNFISVMPTNQYGIGDNFNMETAHLLPMVLRRFHLAKLLAEDNFEEIKKDLAKYKLGWNLDSQTDITKALNQIGAYKDKVVMWGDGSVYRELMSSDDLADACIYLMENKDYQEIGEHINITNGTDIQLKDLFELVKKIVGFDGKIEYDTSKPNGTPRKLMDNTKLKSLGWQPKISLETGIADFYNWYINH